MLIDRTIDMWCICLAISGRCSQMATPSALVEICLNCPPVGAPGFKSQRSIVLGPPPIQSKIAALCRFFRSVALASRELVNAVAGAAIAADPARWLMKWRRFMPDGRSNMLDMVMVPGKDSL